MNKPTKKASFLDRITIDDGRHFARFTTPTRDDNETRYHVRCSCGHPVTEQPTSLTEALNQHLHHVRSKTGSPPKGPNWLPLGARLTILIATQICITLGFYFAAEEIATQFEGLSRLAYSSLIFSSVAAGALCAVGVMIATRHYFAHTRA